MTRLRVLAMTVHCVDIFPELNQFYIGGNSLNFATQAIKSGAETAVLGAVGFDQFGDSILNYYREGKIEHTHLYQIRGDTASNRIFIDEHGDRYFKPDSWHDGLFGTFRLSEDDWEYANSFDVIHIPTTDPNFMDACERMGNTRLIADFLDTTDPDFIERRLPFVQIGFISTPKKKVGFFQQLAEKYQTLMVLTHGSEGSTAIWNKKLFFHPVKCVDKVIDTTGCGDAYQAAFTVEWLESHDIEKAMLKGTDAASRILNHVGGVSWPSSQLEVLY